MSARLSSGPAPEQCQWQHRLLLHSTTPAWGADWQHSPERSNRPAARYRFRSFNRAVVAKEIASGNPGLAAVQVNAFRRELDALGSHPFIQIIRSIAGCAFAIGVPRPRRAYGSQP